MLQFSTSFPCIVSWSYLVTYAVSISDDCATTSGVQGKCVSLDNCTTLLSVMKQKSLSEAVDIVFRQIPCGWEGKTLKICCSPEPWQEPAKPANNFVEEDSHEYSAEDSVLASRDQCGIDRDGDKVNGGEVARIDDFPWMALLGYKKDNGIMQYKYEGFLINRRYVLTTAHCIEGYDKKRYGLLTSVRLGEHDMLAMPKEDCQHTSCQDRLQEIPVSSAYVHPQYKVTAYKQDIGIIRLARRVTYTYYVQPICLVDNANLPIAGGNAVVAGWGGTLNGNDSAVKRNLKINIFEKETCAKYFLSFGIGLGDEQFCGGGISHEDICIGDSGRPLMMKSAEQKWTAVGIISYGYGCGKSRWPVVYTSVGAFLDWINTTLRSTNRQ